MINLHKVVQNNDKIINDILKNYIKTNKIINGKNLYIRKDGDKTIQQILSDISNEKDYVIINVTDDVDFDEMVLIRPERYSKAGGILKNSNAEVISISSIKEFPKHNFNVEYIYGGFTFDV